MRSDVFNANLCSINWWRYNFQDCTDNLLPFSNKTFDLIFSSFVLFEIPTIDGIKAYLSEAERTLKDNGIFIGITGSEHLYSASKKWIHFENNFPENKNAKSGDLVKLMLHSIQTEFTDYYWTEEDYNTN